MYICKYVCMYIHIYMYIYIGLTLTHPLTLPPIYDHRVNRVNPHPAKHGKLFSTT